MEEMPLKQPDIAHAPYKRLTAIEAKKKSVHLERLGLNIPNVHSEQGIRRRTFGF